MRQQERDPYFPDRSEPTTPQALTSIAPQISQRVLEIIADIGKPFPLSLLEEYGVVQAMRGDTPVLAFPMVGGSWHCVNYTTYPEPPRFLTASSAPDVAASLGFLGAGPFMAREDQSEVFLVEGAWDMLAMASLGFPVLALPGVNNLQESWLEAIRGKRVTLAFDNDDPGKSYARQHLKSLLLFASERFNITLPQSRKTKTIPGVSKTKTSPPIPRMPGRVVPIKDVCDIFFNFPADEAREFILRCRQEAKRDKIIAKKVEEDLDEAKVKEMTDGEVRSFLSIVRDGKDWGSPARRAEVFAATIRTHVSADGGKVLLYNKDQELALCLGGSRILTNDEDVNRHLCRVYGFNIVQSVWKQAIVELYNEALRRSDKEEVHGYSLYRDGMLYIGTKNDGVINISSEGWLRWEDQGKDGLYVKSSNDLYRDDIDTPIDNPQELPTNIDDMIAMFDFEERGKGLGSLEQRFLTRVWFYQTFFQPKMRPVLSITGPPGTGKTLLQKLLKGVMFGFHDGIPNPHTIPTEDHVFAMMCKDFRILFLDEVNERNPDLMKRLRTLVTGSEETIRPKYAKNSITFRPMVWLCLSTCAPKFGAPDIAQRLIPVHLAKSRGKRIQEATFLKEMARLRPLIWADVLDDLRLILQNLEEFRDDEIPLKGDCRPIEMATFAWRAFPDDREVCLRAFEALSSAQSKFATDDDGIADIARQWRDEELGRYAQADSPIISIPTTQVYSDWSRYAAERRMRWFPNSVGALSQWMANNEEFMRSELGWEKMRMRVAGRDVSGCSFSKPQVEVFG